MAITYAQLHNATVDGTLTGRLSIAMVKYAKTVALESGATNNHTQRLALAKQVLQNPLGLASTLAYAIGLESAIFTAGSTTDASLDSAVAAAWDAMALGLA